MGSFTSKFIGEGMYSPAIPSPETSDETSKKAPVRILPFDPRSPTPEVVRTPIQVESTPNNKQKFTWKKEARIDKVFKRNFLFRDEQVATEDTGRSSKDDEVKEVTD